MTPAHPYFALKVLTALAATITAGAAYLYAMQPATMTAWALLIGSICTGGGVMVTAILQVLTRRDNKATEKARVEAVTEAARIARETEAARVAAVAKQELAAALTLKSLDGIHTAMVVKLDAKTAELGTAQVDLARAEGHRAGVEDTEGKNV